MSTSRLFNLFGTSIFRNHQATAFLSSIPLPCRPLKLFSSPSLRSHRCCSSAAVLEANTPAISFTSGSPAVTLTSASHPWREWVSFVDRLKTKGYFPPENAPTAEDTAEPGAHGVYTDMNLLKDACLNFARDRFDIFKSLSRQEIQTVVDKGCPNLLRKAVNSAKRLRVYLGLDEGDVCGACHLRGSCDRAYVILKESEAAARTVDIVRILLAYALDPIVIDGKVKPQDIEIIEVSVRNLLHELTELSETTRAPDLPEPVVNVPQPKKKSFTFVKDVEMKRGDWICSQCNFMNFARNVSCRECGEDGPKAMNSDDIEMKKGDWICSECNFMNFARYVKCVKCKAGGPKRVPMKDVQMKKGDWNCPQCGFMNFASNAKCLRCHDSRPKRQLRPGDWECPSCNFLNFKGNIVCKKCNHEGPKDVDTQYEEQIWKKPF
ncbi:uncharacterized protein [Coffea arabica]|uniref:RanBP2-type domain-containing protein n=1 Tax=Coffea arabica TaxID=13443 RepID=A0A6P6XHX0_COFAR|nr:zinc finger protein VAR3, chloroplastic [Coffea arabica]XP_027125607.1 zinc finger protein VAR3, chloroplastic [Coffea arabica]